MEPSVSVAKPLIARACISLHLRPEASAIKNAVLKERNFKLQESNGSKGKERKDFNTTKMSQAGKRLGERASFSNIPFTKSLRRGLSEKEVRPNCLRVVQIEALWPFTVEAESFFFLERKAK